MTYFSKWPDGETGLLHEAAVDLPCGWALSTWGRSGEKRNDAIDAFTAAGCRVIEKHSRHVVGGNDAKRADVTECLVIPPLNANQSTRTNGTDASALREDGREPGRHTEVLREKDHTMITRKKQYDECSHAGQEYSKLTVLDKERYKTVTKVDPVAGADTKLARSLVRGWQFAREDVQVGETPNGGL